MSTDAPTLPAPTQLWKGLSPERRLGAATAFWQDDGAMPEQAEAIALIAQRIKFRARSVMTMAADKKARHLATLAGVTEAVAARLLVAYHLDQQRPMMGRFLDLLSIPHEDGLISEETFPAPGPEKLREAAAALAGEFPPDDVQRYFATLVWQDPEHWAPLVELHGA
jgi:hypothetical protein